MTEPTDDLQQRCAEVAEWQRTGVLTGDALRNYAAAHWAGRHDSLQMAERDTSAQAMQWIAKWGTPPAVAAEVAEHYRNAIALACEGWTMPDGLRKHMEAALWSPPTQAQAGAVPLTDEDLNAKARCEMPKWWNTYGASLCGCAPYLATPPQVYAMRGFLGGFSAGYKLALDTHGIKGGQHGESV